VERVDATSGGDCSIGAWAPQPTRFASLLSLWSALIFAALGCADEVAPGTREPAAQVGTGPSATPEPPSLLSDSEALAKALALATDPLPKPIRALSLRVHSDRLLLQVQAREEPTRVDQYRVKNGELLGPIPVKLTGPGDLKDNLFPLQYADLKVIPKMVRHAERRAALGDGRAREVSLLRNLPESMDIRFRIEVESPLGKRRIDARKDGRILGIHFESEPGQP
jgi:hypothetical protein